MIIIGLVHGRFVKKYNSTLYKSLQQSPIFFCSPSFVYMMTQVRLYIQIILYSTASISKLLARLKKRDGFPNFQAVHIYFNNFKNWKGFLKNEKIYNIFCFVIDFITFKALNIIFSFKSCSYVKFKIEYSRCVVRPY